MDELLQQLRDIHSAPEPHWWPPAIGWWLLALLLGYSLFWLSTNGRRRWRRWRLRRMALGQLQHLFANSSSQELAAELSLLLRRLALSAYPREQVAGLHGEAWLNFLDRSGATDQFSRGPGRLLLDAPYREAADEFPAKVLQELTEQWVRRNF